MRQPTEAFIPTLTTSTPFLSLPGAMVPISLELPIPLKTGSFSDFKKLQHPVLMQKAWKNYQA